VFVCVYTLNVAHAYSHTYTTLHCNPLYLSLTLFFSHTLTLHTYSHSLTLHTYSHSLYTHTHTHTSHTLYTVSLSQNRNNSRVKREKLKKKIEARRIEQQRAKEHEVHVKRGTDQRAASVVENDAKIFYGVCIYICTCAYCVCV
jgi:hypothetical protein